MIETLYLIAYAIILALTSYWHGGFLTQELNYLLAGLGIISVLYWVFRPAKPVPRLNRWLFWPLVLIPCYIVFQMLPLPAFLVTLLSPARAQHIEALKKIMPSLGSTTISLMPAATLQQFFQVIAYILIFITMRDIALRRPARRWAVLTPLIVVAALEAVLGLLQYASGEKGASMAQGTFPNHSHYAGLLGIALPLVLMYAIALVRREKLGDVSARRATPIALLLYVLAGVLFLAVICSLSASGFLACLAALALMAVLGFGGTVRAGWRWAAFGIVALLTVLAFIYIPPDPVIERIAGEMELGEGSRPSLWGQALQSVPLYPLFGSGLGAFEATMYSRPGVMHHTIIDYAHNDYLQLLVELGIIGFAIGALLVVSVLQPIIQTALREPKSENGALALACFGALAAFLIHCFYNFDFYAPANAMMISTISGLSVYFAEGAEGR